MPVVSTATLLITNSTPGSYYSKPQLTASEIFLHQQAIPVFGLLIGFTSAILLRTIYQIRHSD